MAVEEAANGSVSAGGSVGVGENAVGSKELTVKAKQRISSLRQSNLQASQRAAPPDGLGKLDTSLKRHTALLVKFKSSLNTSASVPSILKEIQSLALEKYVEEAVGAIMEGLGKCKTATEIGGAVDIISAMHVRFPVLFTVPFEKQLVLALKPTTSQASDKEIKEKEDNARVIKQRGLLRVLGELEAVCVVRKEKGNVGDLSFGILKELLTADKEQLSIVAPLAIAFAKHLGPLYLPPPSSSTSATSDPSTSSTSSTSDFPILNEGAAAEEEEVLIARETKDKFRKLLVAYFEALARREGKAHLELQKQDKRNHEAYIRSGEVFEDREKKYEKSVKAWERGWASVTQLSELLSLPLPPLPSLTSTLQTSVVTSGTSAFAAGEEIGGPGSVWQDEEEKKFYEDLVDLRLQVPANVLGVAVVEKTETAEEKEKEKEVGAASVTEESATEPVVDDAAVLENPMDSLTLADSTEPSLSSGPAAQLSSLLARLPDAFSLFNIDQISIEFAFLNSKAARKRLVKTLASVGRNKTDILPYYARLVGTLNPFMPDVGKELMALLEDEFRYLQRKKNTDLAETRVKNLRFISELTKFRVTPIHSILHTFKVLLDDFSGPNIDNLATLLEGCGRYLLRTEATNEKMKGVLETMKRKKSAMHLDQRQVTMLENAYYLCDPPDRPIVVPKERSPMQLFIRNLFYNVLTRNTSDKVTKLVRKLNWEDPEVVRKLLNAFTKVWKIKYSNVHLFAVLLYDVGRFHPVFMVDVIDTVLENIRIGMEINNFKYNQQRVATVKYLGELYNYRVVDSRIIFDTLWSLVTFGHPDGRPWPDVPSAVDGPDDFFRVRLVCVLLDTCGSCFDRGALKKKLDSFLTFFQLYVLAKNSIPMDIGFAISDTFEQLRPQLAMFKTFPEALVAVDEMMAAVAKNGPVVEEEIEEEMDESAAREGVVDVAEGEEEEDSGSSTEEASDDDTVGPDSSDEEDEDEELEEGGRGVDPNAMTQDEEDEFTRELAKMMSSTATDAARKTTERRAQALDVGIPFKRARTKTEEEDEMGAGGGRGEGGENGTGAERKSAMTFMLLSKKGKQQSLSIPLESSLALHTLEKRAQDKAEQQALKRHILDYEQREEVAEKQAFKDTLARRGINVRYT